MLNNNEENICIEFVNKILTDNKVTKNILNIYKDL